MLLLRQRLGPERSLIWSPRLWKRADPLSRIPISYTLNGRINILRLDWFLIYKTALTHPQRTSFNVTGVMLLQSVCRAETLGCLLWKVILSHLTHSITALKRGCVSCFSSPEACHFLKAPLSCKVPHVIRSHKDGRCRWGGSCEGREHTGLCTAPQRGLLIAFYMAVGGLGNASTLSGRTAAILTVL